MRWRARLLVLLLIAATGGCRAQGTGNDQSSETTAAVDSTTAPAVAEWQWLLPTTAPAGRSVRQWSIEEPAPCGEASGGCPIASRRVATIAYAVPGDERFDHLADVWVKQTHDVAHTEADHAPLVGGVGTAMAGRTVEVVTGTAPAPTIRVRWFERPDLKVEIESFTLTTAELDAFVAGLQRVSEAEFLAAGPPPPEPPCAQAPTHLAPAVPAGWQQYVFGLPPAFPCGDTVLSFSLAKPGALVTISARPHGRGIDPTVEQVSFGTRQVVLTRSEMVIDEETVHPTLRVEFLERGLRVEVSGINTTDIELAAIVDGIRPVDEATWSALAATAVKSPLPPLPLETPAITPKPRPAITRRDPNVAADFCVHRADPAFRATPESLAELLEMSNTVVVAELVEATVVGPEESRPAGSMRSLMSIRTVLRGSELAGATELVVHSNGDGAENCGRDFPPATKGVRYLLFLTGSVAEDGHPIPGEYWHAGSAAVARYAIDADGNLLPVPFVEHATLTSEVAELTIADIERVIA